MFILKRIQFGFTFLTLVHVHVHCTRLLKQANQQKYLDLLNVQNSTIALTRDVTMNFIFCSEILRQS